VQLENRFSHIIRNRTRDLSACGSVVSFFFLLPPTWHRLSITLFNSLIYLIFTFFPLSIFSPTFLLSVFCLRDNSSPSLTCHINLPSPSCVIRHRNVVPITTVINESVKMTRPINDRSHRVQLHNVIKSLLMTMIKRVSLCHRVVCRLCQLPNGTSGRIMRM
jgi:hypothetical protein